MTFENFLEELHAAAYVGTDDNMPDAFNSWLATREYDDYESYAEAYAKSEVELALEAARIARTND